MQVTSDDFFCDGNIAPGLKVCFIQCLSSFWTKATLRWTYMFAFMPAEAEVLSAPPKLVYSKLILR